MTDATRHRVARTRRVNQTLQAFVSDARMAPVVDSRFDDLDSVAAYAVAWEWAYAAARVAYEAGKKDAANV